MGVCDGGHGEVGAGQEMEEQEEVTSLFCF